MSEKPQPSEEGNQPEGYGHPGEGCCSGLHLFIPIGLLVTRLYPERYTPREKRELLGLDLGRATLAVLTILELLRHDYAAVLITTIGYIGLGVMERDINNQAERREFHD